MRWGTSSKGKTNEEGEGNMGGESGKEMKGVTWSVNKIINEGSFRGRLYGLKKIRKRSNLL